MAAQSNSSITFNCGPCNITFASENEIYGHMLGSKHLEVMKNLELYGSSKKSSSKVLTAKKKRKKKKGTFSLSCETCNITFTSGSQLKAHEISSWHTCNVEMDKMANGNTTKNTPTTSHDNKHANKPSEKQQLQVKGTQKKESEENAIFVRPHGLDFRQHEDVKLFLDYIQKFGEVKTVKKDFRRGKWASVEFRTEDAITSCLKSENHQLDEGKSITVQRKTSGEEHDKAETHSEKATEKTNTIKNQAKEEPKKIQDVKEDIGPTKIEVENVIKDDDHSQSDHIKESLDKVLKCNNIEDQIRVLMMETQLDEDSLTQREAVCQELKHILTPYLPYTTVEMFGSSANGLGVKDCDLDISIFFNMHKYVDQPQACVSEKAFPMINDENINTAELQDLETRVINVEKLKEYVASPANAVTLVNHLLSNQTSGFHQMSLHLTAFIPLLATQHIGTQLTCSITCNHMFGIRQTYLLRFYQEFDPRVRPLMFALSLWAKQLQITDTVATKSRALTNYCLNMLIIFYLQNTQPPVLPTVDTLAAFADLSEALVIDSYDVTFTTDATRIAHVTNYSTVTKLLQGFYHFYADIDFTYYVICSRTGKMIPVYEIDENCQYKEGRRFIPRVLHVQDPFVLDWNISGNVNKFILDRLITALKLARAIIIQPSFGKVPGAGSWGLISLFDIGKELEHLISGGPKINTNQPPTITYLNGREIFRFEVELDIGIGDSARRKTVYPTWQPLSNPNNLQGLKHWWTYKIVNGLMEILEIVFQCNITIEAENLKDLTAQYKSLEDQREKRAAKILAMNTGSLKRPQEDDSDILPEKRLKMDTNDDYIPNETGGSEDIDMEESTKDVIPPEPGVLYCPPSESAINQDQFDLEVQSMFSTENYDKPQLLCSMECKMFTRFEDIVFGRNKVREQLGKEGKCEGKYSAGFLELEAQVSDLVMDEAVNRRPVGYNVVEAYPVMNFLTDVAVVNSNVEFTKVIVDMQNVQPPTGKNSKDKKDDKDKKKKLLQRTSVHFIKGMLMKYIKSCPT